MNLTNCAMDVARVMKRADRGGGVEALGSERKIQNGRANGLRWIFPVALERVAGHANGAVGDVHRVVVRAACEQQPAKRAVPRSNLQHSGLSRLKPVDITLEVRIQVVEVRPIEALQLRRRMLRNSEAPSQVGPAKLVPIARIRFVETHGRDGT